MGKHVKEVDRVPKLSCEPKVHYSICCELVKVLEKIISILPAIESARPGSSSGIQLLCSLNNTIEKTKLLLRYCSESSKLYLAVTAESITSRCERIRTKLNECLYQIQTMVPSTLASKISEVLVYLRHVKFIINPEEEEAGKVLSKFLAQIESNEDQEFKAFQIAASKLNIRSSTALLVERRAINKLLDNFHGIDDKKERLLKYFLHLIEKHGKHLKPHCCEHKGIISNTQDKCMDERTNSELVPCLIYENCLPPCNVEVQSELFNAGMPPQQFCCPLGSWESIHCNSVSSLRNISTALLQGPKGNCIIERGRNMSPLYSASSCFSDSPIADDSESSKNKKGQLFSWSSDFKKYQTFSNFRQDMYLKFLFDLSELPTLQQLKTVEDITDLLEGDEETHCCMVSNGFTEALMKFLKKAHSLSDLEAQRSGAQIFLALVTVKWRELTFENEDAVELLSSFLHCGIEKEAMMILQKLMLHPNYLSRIIASDVPLEVINFINSNDTESVELAMNILSELSSHEETKCHFLSSGYIEKIGQLFCKRNLAKPCLNILQNIADDEEASMLIADSNSCVASLAEVLELGSPEEQEQAVTILLLICSRSSKNCLLILKEGVIPSIVDISVTGNTIAKECSMKLLHVLRNIAYSNCLDSTQPQPLVESDYLDSPHTGFEVKSELTQHPAKNSKILMSDSRYSNCFSRKMRQISKFLALF